MRTADSIEATQESLKTPAANTPENSVPSPADRIAAWRWPKGFCPNPSGRPKRDRASEIAQEVFENNPELLYKAYVKALAKGQAFAFQVLSDRAYGKLKERVEVSGLEDIAAALESARKRGK